LAREPWQIGALFFMLMAIRNVARQLSSWRCRQNAGAQHNKCQHARGARSGNAKSTVSRDVRRLFRLRSKSHIPDDAFTGLSGDLRARSNAERGSARRDWGCERHRLIADRLARREISKAHPSRYSLHPAFSDLRRLFRVAAYSDEYTIVRC